MIDMHVHSTESDGRLSIEEIQKTANKNHIDEIAITDHDILMSADPELCNTNIIKAVEFGITYKNKEVHILGYYVDSSNENLRKISELAINDRANRIDIFEKNFAKFGIKIDKEKVLNYSEVINSKHSFTDIKKYLNIAIKNKLIYTAGSDCHGKQFDGNYLMGNFALNYTTLKSIKKLHELRSNYVIK